MKPVLSDYKTPLLFSCVLLLGMFLGVKMAQQMPSKQSEKVQLDALIALIQEHYVDSIKTQTLYTNGIEGILKSLDPHTVYIPKEKLVISNEELEGSFYGIGTEFFMLHDTVMISSVVKDGPAAKAGVFAGDQVLKINSEWVAGVQIDQEEIVKKIRGQKETPVILLVKHPNGKQENIRITRDRVAYTTVTAAVKLNANTGYIAIRMFSETTYDEFKSALTQLLQEGMQSLIIDVRDNPGGYMDAVAQIADELIGGKQLLVSTRGKSEESKVFSERKGLFETGKLTVLINENSASASEILAGITQDLDRGTVVGRRSYGKGLVQEQYELPDQSAIRITTARYYLPSGRCIQKEYNEGKEKYHEDIYRRYHNGEFEKGDSSVAHTNHKTYYTKNKRKVFANEGVSPDRFVPADTAVLHGLHAFYTEHVADQFAYAYVFNLKKDISRVQDFETNMASNKVWWTSFQQFIKQKKLNYPTQYEVQLQQDVLAQIALVWYGKSGEAYFRAKGDAVIKEALQLEDTKK